MNKNLIVIVVFSLFLFAFKCMKYDGLIPLNFPAPIYNFEENPLDSNKIEIGRTLFYDPILSKDNTISCSSCHSPYNAFSHTDHDLSHGIYDSIGTRNAPALFNLAWHRSFMWDGAINHLDMQALAPINHAGEMGETTKNVVDKLNKSSIYPVLFESAFGTKEITGELMLKALTQFQLTLVSANSKYDQVKSGKKFFSSKEQNGYKLFKQNCNSCHTEPLFSSYQFANNGLPIDSTLSDYGRKRITQKTEDNMLFKIPSLRNLSYSYPYMHDGRFNKLNQVLNHYTNGIKDSPTLSLKLKKKITFSSNEKVDLIAFLKTLDDKAFVFNPKNKFPRSLLLPEKD